MWTEDTRPQILQRCIRNTNGDLSRLFTQIKDDSQLHFLVFSPSCSSSPFKPRTSSQSHQHNRSKKPLFSLNSFYHKRPSLSSPPKHSYKRKKEVWLETCWSHRCFSFISLCLPSCLCFFSLLPLSSSFFFPLVSFFSLFVPFVLPYHFLSSFSFSFFSPCFLLPFLPL